MAASLVKQERGRFGLSFNVFNPLSNAKPWIGFLQQGQAHDTHLV